MKKLVPVIGDICYDNLDIDEKVLEKLGEEVSKTRFNYFFLCILFFKCNLMKLYSYTNRAKAAILSTLY